MIVPDHDSYSDFALVYDEALGKRFFRTVSEILDRLLIKYPSPVPTHLDVACGTGLAVEYFQSRGFRSAGVDASMSMLAIARRRAATLAACDMRALSVRGTFGRITCLYDSLNHLLTVSDLVSAFREVSLLMDGTSLFLFDVNHPEAYPRVWALEEPFVAADSSFRLTIDTSWSDRTGIGIGRITGWLRSGGREFRIDEEHRQRPYSEEEVSAALQEAGLEVVEVFRFDPFGENIEGEFLKMFFVARKK